MLWQAAYRGPPLRFWVLDLPEPLVEGEWLVRRAARHGLPVELHPYPLTATPDREDDAAPALLCEGSGDAWGRMRLGAVRLRAGGLAGGQAAPHAEGPRGWA
ncbi:hypothetical protein [Deinococcus terrestris]|uniref:hypothetical protein n=1 Tax=Deinococcus terrestris TaxID=2651870 RepID=UPI001884562A|nr:hypothetical protein [Deinococcus terrestris]